MVHWLVLRCDCVFQLSRHSEVVRSEREAVFVGGVFVSLGDVGSCGLWHAWRLVGLCIFT